MSSLFLYYFILSLKVFFHFASYAIYKNIEFSKVSLQQILKLWPGY